MDLDEYWSGFDATLVQIDHWTKIVEMNESVDNAKAKELRGKLTSTMGKDSARAMMHD